MKALNNKKGSAILWTVLLSVIITILLGAVMTASYAYFNYTMYTVKRQQAYFTARSAVDSLVATLSDYELDDSDDGEYHQERPLLPAKGSTVTVQDIQFDSKMGTIKEAKLSREPKEKALDKVNVNVTATYVDQDYTINATVMNQPIYFAGIAVKNIVLSETSSGGTLTLGKNTDVYYYYDKNDVPAPADGSGTFYTNKNNLKIKVDGCIITQGDAVIAQNTSVAGNKFLENTTFSKSSGTIKQFWASDAYIISNKYLSVNEYAYDSSWINTLDSLPNYSTYYCNNSRLSCDSSFGYVDLFGIVGDYLKENWNTSGWLGGFLKDNIVNTFYGMNAQNIFNSIGLGNVYKDMKNDHLSAKDSSEDALAIRYIKILSASNWAKDTKIVGAIDKLLPSGFKVGEILQQAGLSVCDYSYIDFSASSESTWLDNVVPVTYMFVDNDLMVRIQYGSCPDKNTWFGKLSKEAQNKVSDILSEYLKYKQNAGHIIVYLGKNATLELGEYRVSLGNNPNDASRTPENLTFYYTIYGEEGSKLILNDGVTLNGEVSVSDLEINGDVNINYSTTNGSQVAKTMVGQYWSVVNYDD